jgi:predicted transport protein
MPDSTLWSCPNCGRSFRQVNQRHACGVGDRASLFRSRPASLELLFNRLESAVRSFGPVEVVTRDRYALFRTTRIFADLTVKRDALRLVIHLGREVSSPSFSKIVAGPKLTAHVALVREESELDDLLPLVREAYDLAVREEAQRGG